MWYTGYYHHMDRAKEINAFFLDLICFSFFTWFATYDVPKTGTEFGQKSKDCGHCHKNPALKSTKIQFTVEQGKEDWKMKMQEMLDKVLNCNEIEKLIHFSEEFGFS